MKKTRILKIRPKFRSRTWDTITVPEIRLEGKWLEKLGFKQGRKIQIQESQNRLVITIMKETEE